MNMFIFKYSIYFLVISTAYGQTPFLPCSDGTPEPLSFNVNCTEYLCEFTAGTVASASFEFVADRKIQDLSLQVRTVNTTDITTLVNYLTIEDVCDSLIDAKCPLKKGQKVTFDASAMVPETEIKFIVLAEVRLVDENNSTVWCFINADLVRPATEEITKKPTY